MKESEYDTHLRIIIINHITNDNCAMELVVRYGLKPVAYAAMYVVDTYKISKDEYSIKKSKQVLKECRIMYPLDKYPEKWI